MAGHVMIDNYKEEHPLLSDDATDEEAFDPQYPRRYRHVVNRGRARNTIKGAAAIINRWPDHWSSSLTYWWMILGMIAITSLIVYNSVVAFALLPPTHFLPTRPPTSERTTGTVKDVSASSALNIPEVFMHLLVNADNIIELGHYLPYVEIIMERNPEFKYNFLVLVNDTAGEENWESAEEQNRLAFSSLWTKDATEKRTLYKDVINIQYISLSHYMNRSPLVKDWRHIPHQFIEFLLRAISVWEKGGIAFNPVLLTPRSPHSSYSDKIQKILDKFKKHDILELTDKPALKKNSNKHYEKIHPKVNNIRDIIDVLEREDGSFNISQESLSVAENKNSITTLSGRKLLSTSSEEGKEIESTAQSYFEQKFKHITDLPTKIPPTDLKASVIDTKMDTDRIQKDNLSKFGLLPLFFEFLFRDNSKNSPSELGTLIAPSEESNEIIRRERKMVSPLNYSVQNSSTSSTEIYPSNRSETITLNPKPIHISIKGVEQDELVVRDANESSRQSDNEKMLTIDLKGYVLATETACHAFIGTVFSNVIHHSDKEALEDFIIVELSSFCNGLLSSCKGIDLILL